MPEALIDIIENAPTIKQLDEDEEEDAEMVARLEQDTSQIEALVFDGDKKGCIKKRELGYLLTWSCLLKKIDNGRIKAQLMNRDDYLAVISCVSEYLEQNEDVYQMLLVIIIAYLPHQKKLDVTLADLDAFEPAQIDIEDAQQAQLMSLYTLV